MKKPLIPALITLGLFLMSLFYVPLMVKAGNTVINCAYVTATNIVNGIHISCVPYISPSPTPTHSPTPTPSTAPTATPTPIPTAIPTATPTATPTPTSSTPPTPTPAPTSTAVSLGLTGDTLALSPFAYYHLSDASGTTVTDAVGHSNGTYTGGFTLGQPAVTSNNASSVLLDGNTGFINTHILGTDSNLGVTDGSDFTITVMGLKFPTLPVNFSRIASNGSDQAPNNGFELVVIQNNRVRFSVRNGASYNYVEVPQVFDTTSKYTMMGGYSTELGALFVCVNLNCNYGGYYYPGVSPNPISIGQGSPSGNNANITINDVAFYNHLVSTAQYTQLYTDATGVVPTPSPTPLAATDVGSFSRIAPATLSPTITSTPAPICVAGNQFNFFYGDDFTKETPANFEAYTTQYAITDTSSGTRHSNWLWSDQYSGIGRENDTVGDSYFVHIDDSNPYNSQPGSWVNSLSLRPGAQILGTPPNAYLEIRAVPVPSGHLADAALGGRHWLSGAIQGPPFEFGYVESSVKQPSVDGGWSTVWQLGAGIPGGGFNGDGTGYFETDIFEKFGNSLGLDTVQMTENSGDNSNTATRAQIVRPTTPNSTTSYHTYGDLWVPAILGQPAYVVFYIDRIPVSYKLGPTGTGYQNYMTNLQIGQVGSFVGSPPAGTTFVDFQEKNLFVWLPSGQPCNTQAQVNPLPTPTPTPAPTTPPTVASNIVPQLQPYAIAPVTTVNTTFVKPPVPTVNGDFVIIQGLSNVASCPTGFVTTQAAVGYVCTGIVGQNGILPSFSYQIGGAGFDTSAIMVLKNVTSYTINPDVSASWHSENPITFSKSQTVTSANALELAFGFNMSDTQIYATAVNYTSNLPFNTIYKYDGTPSYGRGMAMLETNVDVFAAGGTATFTGDYTWTGTPYSNGNNLFPYIVTITVQ